MRPLSSLKGHFIVGENGSVGRIRHIAQRLSNHAIVAITDAHGHHKVGDQLVWPIPQAMIDQLNQPEKAAA